MTQFDGYATAYAKWVAPRFAAIAGLFSVRLGGLPGRSAVLEIAIGTGAVTQALLADGQCAGRTWTGVDLSRDMLGTARQTLGDDVRLVCADAGALPFPTASVDVVVSSFGPVQETSGLCAEALRVLRPDGLLAIAMWDAEFAEWHMMREVRRQLGAPDLPADPVGAACERAHDAGFVDIAAERVSLDVVHDDLASFLAFRAAFGVPEYVTPDRVDEWDRLLRTAAAPYVDEEGRVVLDWRVAFLTAHRAT